MEKMICISDGVNGRCIPQRGIVIFDMLISQVRNCFTQGGHTYLPCLYNRLLTHSGLFTTLKVTF